MLNRKALCQIHFHLSNHILLKEKKIVIAYSFIQKGINTLVKMKFKRLIETCNIIKGKRRSIKLYVF